MILVNPAKDEIKILYDPDNIITNERLRLKEEYIKKRKIDYKIIKSDLRKIKYLIKKINFECYPDKYQLFKNKKTNRLYLTVSTIDFKIVIINYSDRQNLNDQMVELFPEYNFFEKNSAGGFNLFPGNTSTIYGYSDENKIVLESQILEF